MSWEKEFEKAIRLVVSKSLPFTVTEGTVKSVNETKKVCNVERDDLAELLEVRLNSIVSPGDDVFTIYPKIGSKVLCILIENNPTDAYILSVNNVDKFIFNGGQLGGLVKAQELKTQLDKLTARVDGIIDAITNSAVGTSDGGATFKTNMIAVLETLTDKEDFTNLENLKVKH